MDKQQEYVLRAIEERDISFIRLWFTDVSGRLKSVAIAPAEVEATKLREINYFQCINRCSSACGKLAGENRRKNRGRICP